MTDQFYVVVIEDDITPTLYGPYANEDERDTAAILMRQEDEDLKNGIFALDFRKGTADMWAYGAGYLRGDTND